MKSIESTHSEEDARLQRFAMRLSLAVGFVMFFAKIFAYVLTGSAAILSDAAESVVHVVAVSFATYSLSVSLRPADRTHLYGHDKISFFSAGFEGAMIVIAALYIIYVSVHKWMVGLEIQNLGWGSKGSYSGEPDQPFLPAVCAGHYAGVQAQLPGAPKTVRSGARPDQAAKLLAVIIAPADRV